MPKPSETKAKRHASSATAQKRPRTPAAQPNDEDLVPLEYEALGKAIDAWLYASTRDLSAPDAQLARRISHVLFALLHAASAGDEKALTAKDGPDRWAHRYLGNLGKLDPIPRRAEAARRFVRWIGTELRKLESLDVLLMPNELEQRKRPDEMKIILAFANRALGILYASGLPDCIHKPVPGGAALVKAAATEISRVAARTKPKPKPEAFATAILRAWGLRPREAQGVLKLA